ncbi:diaminopimelate decarboxylase [Rubidibacter lacunae KORDI 51-2]|uniref:Diaminopimelate decarboxylase n=1 Tax=Rubidibacter lacunae KORDI 51-2 TaxID=582515 RepID=U5DN75_9CHRO|nr:diaminopimelate decarboxylase [Rubidibacter lacunae]ERN42317.1 diaminopimelate decarboxylase [Rubidibacter lacunae KORDI 51-2]
MPSADSARSALNYLPAIAADAAPNQHLLPLTARATERDRLAIGGCDVVELVARFGSPLLVLDEHTLRTACRQYRDGLATYPGESLVIYASKAWSNAAIAAIAASEGLGIDVASGGELYSAHQAGITPDAIYFHGNNKSAVELKEAIACGCTVVADNWLELETLAKLADPQQPTRVMLRLTPGIECHTHEYIRTGHLDSKFGFDPNQIPDVFAFVARQPALDCVGIHAHIGSQIFERQPHQDLAGVLADWLQVGLDAGLPLRELNVGGGLGICYTEADDPPSIREWTEAVAGAVAIACETRSLPLPKLICEPGRSLVGSAGVTAYTVGGRKEVPGIHTYVAVDGGMSDNARPITYQAVYRALVANRLSAPATATATVAGKHCESGDILIKDAYLPALQPGDVLVLAATGAYCYSMASNYNRLPRPAAVLVSDGCADIIVARETYDDIVRQDRLPDRLVFGTRSPPGTH